MFDKGKSLSASQIDQRIYDFLGHHKYITKWTAELQGRLEHPSNQKYNYENFTQNETGRYEFNVYFSKHITISLLKTFQILSWYLPEIESTLCFMAMDNAEKNKQLSNHIDLSIYRISKIYSLLYLENCTKQSADSFFGNAGKVLKLIKNEVEYNSLKSTMTLFSPQFYYEQKDSERYTGWRRHQNDHGSLSSNNEYLYNILEDQEFQEQFKLKKENYLKTNEDLLQLTIGWLI